MAVPCNSFRSEAAYEFDMIPSGQGHDSLCNTQLALPHLVYICCCGNDCLHAILFSVCDCTVRFTAVHSSTFYNLLLLTVSVQSMPLIPSNTHASSFSFRFCINTITIFILQLKLFLSLSSSPSSSIILNNNMEPKPMSGPSAV